jgi:hypothetical protein
VLSGLHEFRVRCLARAVWCQAPHGTCQAPFPRTFRGVSAEPQPCPPCKPRLGRVVRAIAAGGLLAAIVLAFVPPAGRPTLPRDAEARGEALEQALVSAVTKVRDPAGESWAIAIDPADINAWLATRLPKWVAHDPEFAPFAAASEVRIGSEDGAVILETPIGPSALGLVATVRMPLELPEGDERLRIRIGGVRVGRLPIPFAEAGFDAAGNVQAELQRLEERHPDRRFRLGDGRFIEIRAISCEDGRIKIRFATLPAAASAG